MVAASRVTVSLVSTHVTVKLVTGAPPSSETVHFTVTLPLLLEVVTSGAAGLVAATVTGSVVTTSPV